MDTHEGTFALRPTATLPSGTIVMGTTTDGQVFGLRPSSATQAQFCWDGALGEPFDDILALRDGRRTFFSPDGRHLAFMGRRGTDLFVQRDGKELGPYAELSRSVPPTFSPDGANLVFGATRRSSADAAKDDVELLHLHLDGRPVDGGFVAPIAAVFSPVGGRLAYAEIRKSGGRGGAEFRIVVDGEKGPWFGGMRNAVGALQFSPDGKRFAYYQVDGKGGGWWTVDGTPQQRVDDSHSISLASLRGIGVLETRLLAAFSPDGRRFAYAADVVGKGTAVVEDDVAGPRVKGAGVPVFSPDSRHLAYLVVTFAGGTAVVRDGAVSPEVKAADSGLPAFSPDGERLAFMLTRKTGLLGRRMVAAAWVDGQLHDEVEATDASLRPAFSPASDHVAWWVRRDKAVAMFLDGRPCPRPSTGGEFGFLADGRLAYPAVVDGGQTMLTGDRPGPVALAMLEDLAVPSGPVTPDGRHVLWAGRFADGVRPIADDRVGPAFEAIHGWHVADGRVTWWGQRGDVVYEATTTLG